MFLPTRFYQPTAALGGTRFHPTQLPGLVALYDISDLSTLKEERTGASASTPASVDGVVGTVLDLSGNGNHLTAPSDAARPVLRSSAGLFHLELDDVDDAMAASISASPSVWWLSAGLATSSGVGGRPFFGLVNEAVNRRFGVIGNSSGVETWVPTVNVTSLTIRSEEITGVSLTNDTDTVVSIYGEGSYAAAWLNNALAGELDPMEDEVGGSLTQIVMGGFSTFIYGGRFYAGVIANADLREKRQQIDQWIADRSGVTL